MPSQTHSNTSASSAPVVMLSAPDTQNSLQDVFHTPPEEASLHSSDVDVPLCAVNYADAGSQVFVDSADSSEFVDCTKDSDLGFSEVDLLKDQIDAGFVPEKSCGVVSEKFGVLEREISDLGESPAKKLKLGFGSLGNSVEEKLENGCKFGEDFLPLENVVGSGEQVSDNDSCREIPMDENLVLEENVQTRVVRNAKNVNLIEGNRSINVVGEGFGMREEENVERQVGQNAGNVNLNEGNTSSYEIGEDSGTREEENVEMQVVQNARNVNLVEGSRSSDEVGEGSGMHEDPVLRSLPDSIQSLLEKETASGSEPRKDKGKKKFSVFDVMRALSETANEKEDDGLNVLETAKRAGVRFPRPSWWPENMKSELFNFDDKE